MIRSLAVAPGTQEWKTRAMLPGSLRHGIALVLAGYFTFDKFIPRK